MTSRLRSVLTALASRGIELRLVGDEVRYRPIAAMTPDLAERVREVRDQVALELEARSDDFTAALLDAFDGDVVAADERFETAPLFEPATDLGRCPSCRRGAWWRLRGGGPQVCERCHPCPWGDDAIERWEVTP